MSAAQVPTEIREVSPNGKPLVELKNVRKYFGSVRALDGVDFPIYPNEVHALVGDNAAGKSTLIKIVSGALEPTSGEIYFEGQPVRITQPSDAFELGIATLYQDLALVDVRNIGENLFLGREPTRFLIVDRRRMMAEARSLLNSMKVNIPSVEARVRELSGGQRQAVAIGRIVHEGSRVLLLDEPTAALGVKEAHEMLSLIERLKEEATKAIVVVTHNLAHVFRISDRITVLRRGEIVGSRMKADTNPDEIVKMITGAELL